MFQKNEGVTDRWIRAIVGIAILILAYYALQGTIQIIGYVVGVILIITAITGFCGLYKIFGINTAAKKDENSPSGQPGPQAPI